MQLEAKKKIGRPATKPVTKRKAFYVNVTVENSLNYSSSEVLISKDTVAEVKQILTRSPQKVKFMGYWNGKKYESVPEIDSFIKKMKKGRA